jgi:hypothetical protein
MPLAAGVMDGDVVLAGMSYMTTIDFGGGPLSAPEGYGSFVLRLDGDGQHRQSRMFELSAGGFANPTAIVASGGDLLVGGSFSGTFDPGTGPLTSAGYADAYVARFTP